jgi:hypothetical protein
MTRTDAVLVAGLAVLVVLAGCSMPVAPGGTTDGDGAATAGGGAAEPGTPRFVEVTNETGFSYRTTGPNTGNGDGAVLVSDYDRDGWPDLLAVGGDRPVLFENVGGEFEPSGALPAVNATEIKSGLFFDYDNDGWDDLLLLPRADEPVFLENDGGTFHHADVGLNVTLAWGTSAAAADYDRDGCLDLFVTQNGNWTDTVPARAQNRSLDDDNGNRNLLFEGTCDGFERVTDAGIADTRWSLVTSFVDLTGDGYPDIHVANDFNYDAVYVNQRDGTFRKRDVPGTNRHGMASDVEDVNSDGRPDLFITNIEYPNPGNVWVMQSGLGLRNRGNLLLVNRGNGTFVDRATEYGVRVGGWGWSGNLVDLDNDADLDLIHTTQTYVRIHGPDEDSTDDDYRHVETYPNVWLHEDGEFRERNASTLGLEPANGRGLAVVDFDRDGDRDVVIADTSGPFALYENRVDAGHWLRVRATAGNRTAVGTEVIVSLGNRTRWKLLSSQSNYFSQDPRVAHVGLGDRERVPEVRVVFPDGTEHVLRNVSADRRLTVAHNGTVTTADGP